MRQTIEAFILYLHNVKKTAENTTMSYRRDLNKWADYMESLNITDVNQITVEHLKMIRILYWDYDQPLTEEYFVNDLKQKVEQYSEGNL